MNIQTDYLLKELNTFKVNATTKFYTDVLSVTGLMEVLTDNRFSKENKLILGGGSNILFTKDFDGLVIKNNIQGINVIDDNSNEVIVEAGSGVEWDELVEFCVDRNFGGIENLSIIPGSVGAAPVQNIGAYGQELNETFHSLNGVFINSGEAKSFIQTDCKFRYRDSIFKNELKNKFIITSVQLKLKKYPSVNLSYVQVEEELNKRNISIPAISDIRNVVIAIRKAKLPDSKEIGNAGSFFKNPVIDQDKFYPLKQKYPDIRSYQEEKDVVKISAAWLIEKCGWKEKLIGDVGVHQKQPLVIVNYGRASGKEIFEFSEKIKESVFEEFNIILENEVNIF